MTDIAIQDGLTIGQEFGGTTFCGRHASGKAVKIIVGFGVIVENDGYTYLILDNFVKKSSQMHKHFLEPVPPEYTSKTLSDETIIFWLSHGFITKSLIYGVEVKRKAFICPLSDTGLYLRRMTAPLLGLDIKGGKEGLENLLSPQHAQEWAFFKETGSTMSPHCVSKAPLPFEYVLKKESAKLENTWHYMRFLQGCPSEPYTYTLLHNGKKLNVLLNGMTHVIINISSGKVLPYTPPPSVESSPVSPFVFTNPPPLLSIEECFNGPAPKETLSLLNTSELKEFIDSAYWEMRLLREEGLQWKKEYSDIQSQIDDAYDEIMRRRRDSEEEAEAEEAYTGISLAQ